MFQNMEKCAAHLPVSSADRRREDLLCLEVEKCGRAAVDSDPHRHHVVPSRRRRSPAAAARRAGAGTCENDSPGAWRVFNTMLFGLSAVDTLKLAELLVFILNQRQLLHGFHTFMFVADVLLFCIIRIRSPGQSIGTTAQCISTVSKSDVLNSYLVSGYTILS